MNLKSNILHETHKLNSHKKIKNIYIKKIFFLAFFCNLIIQLNITYLNIFIIAVCTSGSEER